MTFEIKRVYDDPDRGDGLRVLVDRLWPRGVKKASLEMDQWCKDVAPSTELRKWFDHIPERFGEFSKRYRAELKNNDAVAGLLDLGSRGSKVTLLYTAKDPDNNQAAVLRDFLNESL